VFRAEHSETNQVPLPDPRPRPRRASQKSERPALQKSDERPAPQKSEQALGIHRLHERYFVQRLAEEMSRAGRGNGFLSVVLVKIEESTRLLETSRPCSR